tara:strand:+ start:273 stop:500 length:228 start_codon:yes stop_codon:yes gene_type:complete
MMFFYLVSAEGVDLSVAESYAFDVAKENVILCCLAERAELGQVMTREEARRLVNDNYSDWSEFQPTDGPSPPGGN